MVWCVVRCGVAWCGVVQCVMSCRLVCMVWCVVRCGVAWCDAVCDVV